MKRLLSFLTAPLLGIAFFVAWPDWAAYEIYGAIQAKDATALERKIDLPAFAPPCAGGRAEDRSALRSDAVGPYQSGACRATEARGG